LLWGAGNTGPGIEGLVAELRRSIEIALKLEDYEKPPFSFPKLPFENLRDRSYRQ
jgi:hypothetical protein